ncbi:MAG: protein arginine kinase [Clostridia bacterium]|jgi:protein arginine kinase
MTSWYIAKGPESDVALSSRVRIARNLKEYPFPNKLDGNQALLITNRISNVLKTDATLKSKAFKYYDLARLNETEKNVMIEKHLISPDIVKCCNECGVFISRDEKISIMMQEEDHIRIQCMLPGNQIENVLEMCMEIDNIFEKNIKYAFNEEFGYLTSCPTNVGTGIRASVMLHLPALTMTGLVKGMLTACSKIGIAIRGIYGENSESLGQIYQISNQVTLGQNEKEIITNVSSVVFQIIEQERLVRKELQKQNKNLFKDRIMRAYGIMTNAEIMSSQECLNLISEVRLGINMGILKNIKIETLNKIMLLIQPGNLQKHYEMSLNERERDIMRSKLIKELLNPIKE